MEADVVIIGGGTAAIPLCSVLSKKFEVIVVEAGDDNDRHKLVAESTLEGINLQIADTTGSHIYSLKTEPEKGLADRQLYYVTAKELGGNSSLNGARYTRASMKIHGRLCEITGAHFWHPRIALNMYMRDEEYHGPTDDNLETRGNRGPIKVRLPSEETKMAKEFVDAYHKVTGAPIVIDHNAETPEDPIHSAVFTRWQLTDNKDGTRNSVSRVFILPTSTATTPNTLEGVGKHRHKILLKTLGVRAIATGGKITGVIVRNPDGKEMEIKARKEVICCAGAQSFAFLQRSGIGDASLLKRLSIPLLFDNPNVGRNHKDSAMILVKILGPKGALPKNDPYAKYCGGAFLPDVLPGSEEERGYMINYLPAVLKWRPDMGIPEGKDILILNMLQLRSRSTGYGEIRSADPTVEPLLVENLLTHPDDMEGFKIAIQKYIVAPIDELIRKNPIYSYLDPSREVLTDTSEGGKLEQFLRQNAMQSFHYCGTCRSGKTPETSVVDGYGRVYGVSGLRVVDASILPIQMGGALMAPIISMARTIGYSMME